MLIIQLIIQFVYRSNVEGTLCMLECDNTVDNGLDLFVHVSTDEVYGALGSRTMLLMYSASKCK